MMNNNKVSFKRIARFESEPGKHIALSLANNDSYTFTQFLYNTYQDGTVANIPIPGAIRCTHEGLFSMLEMIIWVVTRFPDNQIPEEYKPFINALKSISNEELKEFEYHMQEIGFPATSFRGQPYHLFNQHEEVSTKNHQ